MTMPTNYDFLEVPSLVKGASDKRLLKICSYNVFSLRASTRKGLLGYLQAEDPAILCLQETKLQKPPPENDPFSYEKYPYQHWWCSTARKGYSGTAILSKVKPLACFTGFVQDQTLDNEGRVITLEFENFFLVNVYAPFVGMELARLEYRMKWESDVRLHLNTLERRGKPIVYAGDLNVAHHVLDLANGKKLQGTAGFTIEERECFQQLLDGDGMPRVDVDRYFHPNEAKRYTAYSFNPRFREKCLGWRLDYFVVSQALMSKVYGSAIRFECFGASDHLPLVLWLEQ
ncbi:hypothetical protein DSO57_1001132 [Entomophthora muscae]|nr:hypothetical protein DSO57_1001132 [Entomophthora muscae]